MSEAAPPWLEDKARIFSDNIGDLLTRTLPDAPNLRVEVIGENLSIAPDGQESHRGGVPLMNGNGDRLAWLRIAFACRPDSAGKYLAVDNANFWVSSDKERSPLLRFEYCYESRSAPHSHIQMHAERGAFSALLARTRHRRPHDLSALHLPTGGSRFRPGLEDVIQFLIEDCRVKAVDGWRDAVNEHRATWRKIQTAAAARAMPEVAAKELVDLGYTVTAPEGGHPVPTPSTLHAW